MAIDAPLDLALWGTATDGDWAAVGLGDVAEGLDLPDGASFLEEVRRRAAGSANMGGNTGGRSLSELAALRISATAPDWQFAAARLLLRDLYAEAWTQRRAHDAAPGDLYRLIRMPTDAGLYDERILHT
jgi:hypothetical protein